MPLYVLLVSFFNDFKIINYIQYININEQHLTTNATNIQSVFM